MKNFFADLSFSSFTSGLLACLVGYMSSAILVFQLAVSLGLDSTQASFWIGILCVGMGVLTIFLSLKHKMPIMFAWSTPGVALLMTSLSGFTISQAVGVFVVSSALTIATGLSGQFDRVMKSVPSSVASAMIAGILIKFCFDIFTALQMSPLLVAPGLAAYFIVRAYRPIFAVPSALIVAIVTAIFFDSFNTQALNVTLLQPHFVQPEFSLQHIVGVAIPLFLITMTSQNVTGFSILRAYQYDVSGSELITASGLMNLIIAPFGGFTINLAALTAAICAGEDCHPDKTKRYTGAVVSGLTYIVMGIFSTLMASIFAAVPKALILSIGGLALLSVVSNNIENIFSNQKIKDSAIMTFLVTASGASFLGIGSAFWGLLAGFIINIKNILKNKTSQASQ